jgi:hypothetical protein
MPHQELDGRTPAEAAGIGFEGENKWMNLLRKSLSPSKYK